MKKVFGSISNGICKVHRKVLKHKRSKENRFKVTKVKNRENGSTNKMYKIKNIDEIYTTKKLKNCQTTIVYFYVK